MKKNALTLMEVLIAAILMTLIFVSLANVFVSGRRYLARSIVRMTCAELGRYFLGSLQEHVNAETWGLEGNDLSETGTEPRIRTAGTDQGLDRNYTATMTVTPTNFPTDQATFYLRRVRISIAPDVQP